MSRRNVTLFVVLAMILFLASLLFTGIQYIRIRNNRALSENHLRQLSLFAAHHVDPVNAAPDVKLPHEVPAATIVLQGVDPEERLSWLVSVLPGLDQRRNPIPELLGLIDVQKPWSFPENQRAARLRVNAALCPENTPRVGENAPAITCYVGITGIGPDAASRTVPAQGPISPRAGAFHSDGPTPFDRIQDGLSQTFLLGETALDPGPWLRGGPSTARGVDDAPNAKIYLGDDGQFGGFFPGGGYFSMCDGSVRFVNSRISPAIFRSLATIAGGNNEIVLE